MSLIKTLKNFGLNEKQAKIYLACLELGSASVYKIAQKSGYPRSTCYDVLDGLKQKGLINTFLKKKVKFFTVEDLKNLITLQKEKLNILEDSLPQLNALYGITKERPTVRFYQGKEQMKMILREILKDANEFVAIGSADDVFKGIGDYFYKFVKERVKRKIPIRVIIPDSAKARERRRLGHKELRQTKIINKKYFHHGMVFIWGNKIAMFSLKKELVALVIESEELAQTHLAMFEFMWETGGFVE